jgi:hypothetical protein
MERGWWGNFNYSAGFAYAEIQIAFERAKVSGMHNLLMQDMHPTADHNS